MVWETIDAINDCPQLAINFPKSHAELEAAAAGFQSISYGDAINNCVGAIDGYLLAIQTPTKALAGNVRSYFSGHNKTNGVNVQAICDHLCRFTFFSVAGPGSMPDRVALKECEALTQPD